jgi:hypothetical protein
LAQLFPARIFSRADYFLFFYLEKIMSNIDADGIDQKETQKQIAEILKEFLRAARYFCDTHETSSLDFVEAAQEAWHRLRRLQIAEVDSWNLNPDTYDSSPERTPLYIMVNALAHPYIFHEACGAASTLRDVAKQMQEKGLLTVLGMSEADWAEKNFIAKFSYYGHGVCNVVENLLAGCLKITLPTDNSPLLSDYEFSEMADTYRRRLRQRYDKFHPKSPQQT